MDETKISAISMDIVDLTSCEREPIHIPGRIQSHGFLLAIDKLTKTISHASENIHLFIQSNARLLLNRDINDLIFLTNINLNYSDFEILMQSGTDTDYEIINPVKVKFGNESFNLVVHPSNDFVLFEFEPVELIKEAELYGLLGVSLSKILEAGTFQKALQFAAKQVKEIIRYDRVMIYKFWEDEHGEVLAEEKNDGIDSFMGLHYPATDIPRQARELYKANLVRLIANVDSIPAALLASDVYFTKTPLDLTHSTLRAVSPIHIEYLKNMGVKASFSISIIVNDRLWGLIACHNYKNGFIGYEARNNAKLIGKILSSSLEYRLEEEVKRESVGFEKVLKEIKSAAVKDLDIAGSLTAPGSNVLRLTDSQGVALFFENKLYTFGITPPADEINDLITWVGSSSYLPLFQTDNLSKLYSPAFRYKDIASGLLSCMISRELNESILWFKPEFKRTVAWAGNPDKPAQINQDGNSKLSPRNSFEKWIQEVEGASVPWSRAETLSALKVREEIVALVNQKAQQVNILNEKLQKAYDELDTFSFTISHDLKTPLATIKSYAELLLEDYVEISEEAKNIVLKVVKSADHMNLLIKEVLSYSQIERQILYKDNLNMNRILEDIKNDLLTVNNKSNIEIVVNGTPSIKGDNVMIHQVFANVVGNAIKYSSKSEKPLVIIKGREDVNQVIYTISDNGIGIDLNYGNQVFDLFKRLQNVKDYEGTGIGLAIVKRIMEKHQAKVWYESELHKGTTFYLSFMK